MDSANAVVGVSITIYDSTCCHLSNGLPLLSFTCQSPELISVPTWHVKTDLTRMEAADARQPQEEQSDEQTVFRRKRQVDQRMNREALRKQVHGRERPLCPTVLISVGDHARHQYGLTLSV